MYREPVLKFTRTDGRNVIFNLILFSLYISSRQFEWFFLKRSERKNSIENKAIPGTPFLFSIQIPKPSVRVFFYRGESWGKKCIENKATPGTPLMFSIQISKPSVRVFFTEAKAEGKNVSRTGCKFKLPRVFSIQFLFACRLKKSLELTSVFFTNRQFECPDSYRDVSRTGFIIHSNWRGKRNSF